MNETETLYCNYLIYLYNQPIYQEYQSKILDRIDSGQGTVKKP